MPNLISLQQQQELNKNVKRKEKGESTDLK